MPKIRRLDQIFKSIHQVFMRLLYAYRSAIIVIYGPNGHYWSRLYWSYGLYWSDRHYWTNGPYRSDWPAWSNGPNGINRRYRLLGLFFLSGLSRLSGLFLLSGLSGLLRLFKLPGWFWLLQLLRYRRIRTYLCRLKDASHHKRGRRSHHLCRETCSFQRIQSSSFQKHG